MGENMGSAGIECPRCHAAPGSRCKTPRGNETVHLHADRKYAARVAEQDSVRVERRAVKAPGPTEIVDWQLAVCTAMSPDPSVAGDFQALREALDMAHEMPARQVEILALSLCNGLKHGNWPQQFKN